MTTWAGHGELASPEALGFSSARLARISDLMRRHVDRGELAGAITLVARRGKVVHWDCLGWMDAESARPMQADAILRVYSMTKPVTAVAILMLYEEGRLLLDDPVSCYIPSFKNPQVLRESASGPTLEPLQRSVTIHDLLTHTAGLSYGFTDARVDGLYRQANLWRRDQPLEAFIDKIARLPLAQQPGVGWRYSVAYDVLGYLVQVISGRPFPEFLQERLFEPLGMADTGFYVPPDKLDRLAALYARETGGSLRLAEAPAQSRYRIKPERCGGGGGLVSTARDYLRFATMLLRGGEMDGVRVLGRKTVALLSANHLPSTMLPYASGPRVYTGYGFGLGVSVLLDPAQAHVLGSAGSYGWSGMAGTWFRIDPQEEMVLLFMPQLINAPDISRRHEEFQVLAYQALADPSDSDG